MIENQLIPIAAMLILLGIAIYYGRRAGWPARPGVTVTVDSYRYWLSLGALLLIAVVKLTSWGFGHGSHAPAARPAVHAKSIDTDLTGIGE